MNAHSHEQYAAAEAKLAALMAKDALAIRERYRAARVSEPYLEASRQKTGIVAAIAAWAKAQPGAFSRPDVCKAFPQSTPAQIGKALQNCAKAGRIRLSHKTAMGVNVYVVG